MRDYISLNNQKIMLTEEQVAEIRKSFNVGIKLADVHVGEIITVAGFEFIVLEHSKETTAVILKDLLVKNTAFGSNNNFAESKARDICRNFACKLATALGTDALVKHTVDLTSDDGLKDYGTIKEEVSLLTANQYRRYVEVLDKHKIDAWWWLATAYSTPTHNSPNWVKCVSPSGCIDGISYYYDDIGVRPFCILKSNIFVSK